MHQMPISLFKTHQNTMIMHVGFFRGSTADRSIARAIGCDRAMSRRNLSRNLRLAIEQDDERKMDLEESIDIGETTLRKDGLAINISF